MCGSSAECESWQICDVANRRCLTRPGYCSSDAECGIWQKCNKDNNKCETKVGYCTNGGECAYDERCETDPYSANAYRCVKITCTRNEECPGGFGCDPETQRCRKQN